MPDLPGVDLLSDHGKEALVAEEVLTAGQEGELLSEEAALADLACMLFRVETSFIGSSGQLANFLHLCDVLKSQLNVAAVILCKVVWVLRNQGCNQVILDLADHLVDGG